MIVAAVQMNSGDDVESNVRKALTLVRRTEADLIVLPEVFPHATRHDDGSILARMSEAARERGVWLSGSLLLEGYNTAFLIRPDGEIQALYRKIHLFDVPGLGNESECMKAGRDPVTAEIDGWKVGLAICYDLRYPELFRKLEADLYLVPSAFSRTTGRDHWEILVRARAIENLAYVVAPNQEGDHPNGTTTWGHSLVVDPWGRMLGEGAGEGAIVAALDRETLETARQALPALRHRKLLIT